MPSIFFPKEYIALIVSFITGYVALVQVRKNHVNNARLAWLDNFKKLLADFIAEGLNLQLKRGLIQLIDIEAKTGGRNEKAEKFADQLMETNLETLRLLELKYGLVKLNLNPQDPLHQKLSGLLNEYMQRINYIPKLKSKEEQKENGITLRAYSRTLSVVSRHIFNIEWQSIRRSWIHRIVYFHLGGGRKLIRHTFSIPLITDELANEY